MILHRLINTKGGSSKNTYRSNHLPGQVGHRKSPMHAAQSIYTLDTHYPKTNEYHGGVSYWHQRFKDRLFVCYDTIQSGELKKMIKTLKGLTAREVEWRRANDPFKDEVDLKRR